MREFFRTCAGIGLVAVLVGTSVVEVRADPVTVGSAIRLNLGAGTGGNGGGEFYVDVESTGVGTDFVTFCLQINEYFTPGATMYVGGISEHTVEGGTPLSAGTAYLYSMYRAGTLSGYDTSSLSAHRASATALQLAIWVFQGQMDRSVALTQTSSVSALVNVFLGFGDGAVASGWGIGQVRVLNLFGTRNSDGTFSGNRQDQLTLVPEPGTLALLLVGGVFTLAGRRRRLRVR